jgi:hypothetical protein
VSLDHALADEAYGLPENYVGRGGFSWIHRWSITKGMPPIVGRVLVKVSARGDNGLRYSTVAGAPTWDGVIRSFCVAE